MAVIGFMENLGIRISVIEWYVATMALRVRIRWKVMTVYVHMSYTNIRSLQGGIVEAAFTTSFVSFIPEDTGLLITVVIKTKNRMALKRWTLMRC